MTMEERLETMERELNKLRATFSGNVLRVNQVIVEDETGSTRACLSMHEDGPRLDMFDETGECRIVMCVTEDGPYLGLNDEESTPRSVLDVYAHGPRLTLYDKDIEPRVWLCDDEKGPALWMFGSKGRAILRSDIEGPTLKMEEPLGLNLWEIPKTDKEKNQIIRQNINDLEQKLSVLVRRINWLWLVITLVIATLVFVMK